MSRSVHDSSNATAVAAVEAMHARRLAAYQALKPGDALRVSFVAGSRQARVTRINRAGNVMIQTLQEGGRVKARGWKPERRLHPSEILMTAQGKF